MTRQIVMILMAFAPAGISAASPSPAQPRWFVGDWCYPEGRPLRLKMGDAFDGDESTTYRADGTWQDEAQSGTWRISGGRLIETRTRAEPWSLSKGEQVRQTWTIAFRRHGLYAIEMKGGRRGWSVKCPAR